MIPSHLVQQRLEQVVVRAIDDRDVDVYLGEFAGDIHAPETPHHHDLGTAAADAVLLPQTSVRL
jgi:hypothetical protein